MSNVGSPAPFPWEEVLHAALGILRWPPATVWAATPREIALALAPPRRPAMSHDDLAALLAAFPDPTPARR